MLLQPAVGWDGGDVLRTFCPGWSEIAVLPISTSQVAGITGLSHYSCLPVYIFERLPILGARDTAVTKTDKKAYSLMGLTTKMAKMF
jgi:hypothetical protein